MSDRIEELRSLHTTEIDARNGYQEALKEAEGRGMSPLFSEMIALHDNNASIIAGLLGQAGAKADESGSFMTVVHKTIMDIRSLFGGLDETVLPGLIDGEKRNIAKYDEAINAGVAPELSRLRTTIVDKVRAMEVLKKT